MSEYRLMRIEGVIQEIISTLILTGKVKDHRVSRMISINRVKCSSDLSVAKMEQVRWPGWGISVTVQ